MEYTTDRRESFLIDTAYWWCYAVSEEDSMAITKQTRKLLEERKHMIKWLAHAHNPGEGIGDFLCETCLLPGNHPIHTQPAEKHRICRKA